MTGQVNISYCDDSCTRYSGPCERGARGGCRTALHTASGSWLAQRCRRKPPRKPLAPPASAMFSRRSSQSGAEGASLVARAAWAFVTPALVLLVYVLGKPARGGAACSAPQRLRRPAA